MKEKEITATRSESEKNCTSSGSDLSDSNKNKDQCNNHQAIDELTNLEISRKKSLIKKCHLCGNIIESYEEVQKCPVCKKHFLPINYFAKLSKLNNKNEYMKLFSTCDELSEEDLIKGLYVLW